MKKTIKEKFLWGVVNIGQQTEGYNKSSNWQKWANRGLVPSIHNINNYWLTYVKYHDLVEDLGCNSMRITIEWSRLEPNEGKFNFEALKHYQEILEDLKKRNIITVVGLWHWSVPVWFEQKYGTHSNKCVKLFLNFAEYVCNNLGDLIDYVVILNEPSVYVSASYITAKQPPFLKNYFKAFKVYKNLIRIHKSVYKMWKEKYTKTQIGTTYLYNYEIGRDNSFLQNLYLHVKQFLKKEYMLYILQNYSDYIGLNYYSSDSFFFGKSGGKWGVHGTNDWHNPEVWKIFPEGLYFVLKKMNKYKKPILILENGKPTIKGINDKDRQIFLQEIIKYIQKAIKEGIYVKGYFHYSLVDSYEWSSGYKFKFGLVEVDYKTGKKLKRNSFYKYKDIIKNINLNS